MRYEYPCCRPAFDLLNAADVGLPAHAVRWRARSHSRRAAGAAGVAVRRGEEEEAGGQEAQDAGCQVQRRARKRARGAPRPRPTRRAATRSPRRAKRRQPKSKRRRPRPRSLKRTRGQEAPEAGQGARRREIRSAGGGGPIAFRFGIGGKALFRNLSWTDDGGGLAPYTLSPGPQAGVVARGVPGGVRDRRLRREHRRSSVTSTSASARRPRTPAGNDADHEVPGLSGRVKVRFPFGMFQPVPRGRLRPAEVLASSRRTPPGRTSTTRSSSRAPARASSSRPRSTSTSARGYLYVMNPGSSAGDVARQRCTANATAYGVDADAVGSAFG